ncbi:MAG: hypothetical protein ABIH37_00320 [archaeon]
MDKILFLGSGSKNDPGFEGIQIEGVDFKDHMRASGIGVIDDVVMSSHGCPKRAEVYFKAMQQVAEKDYRVVALLEGGLEFVLPGLGATQTTFPIFSVPMDNNSYQAFMLPSGHAAIATVGLNSLRGRDSYLNGNDEQKINVLTLAQRILNLDVPGVNILEQNPINDAKLRKILDEFGVTINEGYDPNAMSLAYGNDTKPLNTGSFLLRADPNLRPDDWESVRYAQIKHNSKRYTQIPAAEVFGTKNLAIMATKILSNQKPELRETIREIGRKKLESYGVEERNLVEEVEQYK